VRYDDFTVDTAENRWLWAAVLRLARLPGVDPRTRHRLRRLDLVLSDVTAVTSVHQLEPWTATRLNARYHDALRLAEVVVRSASFEQAGEGLKVSGFVLDMAQVFEDFVCTALGASLVATDRGRAVSQDRRWALDAAHEVALRPDQLLAYCTALGLPDGHLVYAKGNEAGRTHHVPGAGVTLHAHTLDLDQPPAGLLAQVDALAATLASTTTTSSVAASA
jgi:5-methylcytosine-specific restriction enzyme subunit McrC